VGLSKFLIGLFTASVLMTGISPEAAAQAALPGYFNVKDYGAKGDGSTDDTAAINNAIAAAAIYNGASGAVVYFPTGQYEISSTIDLPNRVALHGPNGRGAKVQALKSFALPYLYMFHAHNGTSSMFGSRIQDMDLDFNDVQIPGSAIVEADAWQETCGLERVLLEKFTQYGLLLANGYGGASFLPLKDIEVFGSAYPLPNQVGIFEGPSLTGAYGGFILSIDGGTFSGGTIPPPANSPPGSPGVAVQLPIGIELVATLVGKGLHFEQTTTGIYHYGKGGLSIDTLTGASLNPDGGYVTNLIEIGSAFTGVMHVRNIIGNGMNQPDQSIGPLIQIDATGTKIFGGSQHALTEYVLDQQP